MSEEELRARALQALLHAQSSVLEATGFRATAEISVEYLGECDAGISPLASEIRRAGRLPE